MFAHLVLALRSAGLPASMTEYLTLMGAMKAGVAEYSVEDFYYLARATLVKDERHLDKFDRVFAQCFKGLEPPEGVKVEDLPEEWLRKLAEKLLTPEEMEKIEALGGFDAIMNRLKELLAEQKGRHQGATLLKPMPGEVRAPQTRIYVHDLSPSLGAEAASADRDGSGALRGAPGRSPARQQRE